jgi:hypothetical protein
LDELLGHLSEGNLTEIDFDRLKEWLQQTRKTIAVISGMKSELQLMREDYIGRISGMVKAITIVERKSDNTEEALSFLGELNELKAAELIEQYRKTSNRFRIAFPSTFGLPLNSGKGSTGLKDSSDYK